MQQAFLRLKAACKSPGKRGGLLFATHPLVKNYTHKDKKRCPWLWTGEELPERMANTTKIDKYKSVLWDMLLIRPDLYLG